MDEYLWPARNVAEYAYCPRLFYLMEVEGLHLANADTERGVAVHRRVDRPSKDDAAQPGEDPDRPRVVRSMTLTSKALGLTATLDLAEVEGASAVPVEYRKGHPHHPYAPAAPDDPGEGEAPAPPAAEPWPTDRVQVGFQSLLLEEAGFCVPEAVLYYASEKLRLRLPVDAALRGEALQDAARCPAVRDGPAAGAPRQRSALRAMLAGADLPTG